MASAFSKCLGPYPAFFLGFWGPLLVVFFKGPQVLSLAAFLFSRLYDELTFPAPPHSPSHPGTEQDQKQNQLARLHCGHLAMTTGSSLRQLLFPLSSSFLSSSHLCRSGQGLDSSEEFLPKSLDLLSRMRRSHSEELLRKRIEATSMGLRGTATSSFLSCLQAPELLFQSSAAILLLVDLFDSCR